MGQLRSPGAAPAAAGVGRRLYDRLRGQMTDGTFAPGGRVPSTRALAAELGLSRTTVTAVFDQLAAESILRTD